MANILAIEDDPSFLGLLRVHLSGAGHTVDVAEDAAVGLRAVLENRPDLVLLDLNVPFLQGLEILEALRSDPLTRAIPVIIITGQDDEDSYVRALRIGVDGYLTKPVQRETLLSAIETSLGAIGTGSAA